MNSVTTADLRNRFREVSSWLDNGESVEILKRGRPYARLSPVAKESKVLPQKIDFRAQCASIWKGRKFSAAEVAEMREAELDGVD